MNSKEKLRKTQLMVFIRLSNSSLFRYLEIYQSAMDLYGLIHARFILSPRGLALMREKYMLGTFGTCQRVLCERQFVLPIGLSEELSTSRVKVILYYQSSQMNLDLLSQVSRSLRSKAEASRYWWSLLWYIIPSCLFKGKGKINWRGSL